MPRTKFRKWSVFAAILVVAAASIVGFLVYRQRGAEKYEDFETILEKRYFKLGSHPEVLERPDRKGPYAVINILVEHMDSPLSGWVEANGKRRSIAVPAEKGAYIEVVALETEGDGEPTFAILRGHAAKQKAPDRFAADS